MAYNKAEEIENVLRVIEENDLTFFDEISLFVAPNRKTLYEWELHKSDPIKEALEKNKLKKKKKLRRKWEDSENATLQIAAFKLLADDDEMARLSTTISKNEHTGKDGEKLFPEKTDEQVKKEVEEMLKRYGK